MKVTPQISADLEEYPELRKLVNMAVKPIVDLMGIHAIASVRRMHKTGVFDHPYVKDVVVPLNVPTLPQSVHASQYTVGKSILDYLEAVGISGVSLELSQEELQSIVRLWAPPSAPPSNKAPLEPTPVPSSQNGQDAKSTEKPGKPGKPKPAKAKTQGNAKEEPNGRQAAN